MDYVRLYTDLLTHPKAEGLSDRSWRVLTLAWLYAGRHETDGRIPPEAKRFVRMTTAAERELTDRGWLHRNGNGWVLHDWDHHQEQADAIKRRRELSRERVRRHRAKASQEDTP